MIPLREIGRDPIFGLPNPACACLQCLPEEQLRRPLVSSAPVARYRAERSFQQVGANGVSLSWTRNRTNGVQTLTEHELNLECRRTKTDR